jgi:hypothetical protein
VFKAKFETNISILTSPPGYWRRHVMKFQRSLVDYTEELHKNSVQVKLSQKIYKPSTLLWNNVSIGTRTWQLYANHIWKSKTVKSRDYGPAWFSEWSSVSQFKEEWWTRNHRGTKHFDKRS